jgi:hypothetical protein
VFAALTEELLDLGGCTTKTTSRGGSSCGGYEYL